MALKQQKCYGHFAKRFQSEQDGDVYPIAPHTTSLQVMDHLDGVECTLATCAENAINKSDNHDAIKGVEIGLKRRHHSIHVSRLVIEYTIEGTCDSDVISSSGRKTIHAYVNDVELFACCLGFYPIS